MDPTDNANMWLTIMIVSPFIVLFIIWMIIVGFS